MQNIKSPTDMLCSYISGVIEGESHTNCEMQSK